MTDHNPIASHVRGADTPPLLTLTVGACLARAAAAWPDAEALVARHQARRFSFAQLHEQVDALAAGLLALGLNRGDRIGIWSPNRFEWVLLQFASARVGIILVTINPAYRLAELEHALTLSGCRALVTAIAFKGSDYLSMLRTLLPELERPGPLHAARTPDLRWVIHLGSDDLPGMMRFDRLVVLGTESERRRVEEIAVEVDCRDAVNLQFTSGTTGLPKATTLSHHNIVNNAQFVAAAMGLRHGDRLCVPVPLYHCFGMVMSSLACVLAGATMVFPAEGFDPLAVLQTVQDECCTMLHGVPTMFIAEMAHPEFARFDLSTLRGGIMAGSPCPIEVMRSVMERMHMAEITIAYGMTETSPVSFQSSVDDAIERRVSTVGRIQPHLEAKIVDLDGEIVPRGVSGELLVRGYSVMKGYWGDDKRTREVVDGEGWMHTGDLAVLDEDGYCQIVGRAKDMLIRGGENIFPREIEEYLHRHPGIETVQAFGVPDDKYGEEVCVWVKLRAGAALSAEDLRAFCQDQIAHYKVPRHIVFVDEFPMTATGKIQKFIMREIMVELLTGKR